MSIILKALKYVGYNLNEERLTVIGKFQQIEENDSNILLCIEETSDFVKYSRPRRIIDFSEHSQIPYWCQVQESPTRNQTEFTIFLFYPIKGPAENTEKIQKLFAEQL